MKWLIIKIKSGVVAEAFTWLDVNFKDSFALKKELSALYLWAPKLFYVEKHNTQIPNLCIFKVVKAKDMRSRLTSWKKSRIPNCILKYKQCQFLTEVLWPAHQFSRLVIK